MQHKFTQRTLALLMLLTISLSGCGKKDEATSQSSNEQTTVATHIYTDAVGRKVTLPVDLKSIVTLNEVDLDVVLALGIKPVASIQGRGQKGFPRFLDSKLTQGIQSLGGFGNVSFETILASSPDVIFIGSFYNEKYITKLQAIAPVVVSHTMKQTWKDAFANLAKLLHKEEAHKQVMAKYNQRIAEIRTQLGDRMNDTISIIRWNPKGPMFMSKSVYCNFILDDLGLKRPAHQQLTGTPHSPILSLESLDQLDADWIFMGTLSPTGESSDAMASAISTPAFKALHAVKNNQFVAVDGSVWTSTAGPLGAMHILNDVAKAMTPK